MKRLRPVILVAVAVMMLGLFMPSSASAFRLYQVPPTEETVDDSDQAADAPIEEQQQSDPVEQSPDEGQQVPEEQEQSEPPAQDPPADDTSDQEIIVSNDPPADAPIEEQQQSDPVEQSPDEGQQVPEEQTAPPTDPPADDTSDQDQQSEPMQIQSAAVADPTVSIVPGSLTCSGAFSATFGGESSETVGIVWRNADNGAVLSQAGPFAFPAPGTYDYAPGTTISVVNLVATVFVGDFGSGGPGASAPIMGCNITPPPPDPVDPPTISFDCTGLVVADVPGSNEGTVTLSVAVPGDPVVTFDSFDAPFTKPGIYSHTFDLAAAGNLDSYIATVLVDDHRVSTTITGCAPVVPDPVVITGNSLQCDGSFIFTITGEAEAGTMLNLGWRNQDSGAVLNSYSVPFPGPGQHTYDPEVAVSADNMIANAFIGDIGDGGPNGFATVDDCNTSPPDDTETEYAKALDSHGCEPDDEWHFIITGVTPENAPATITVTWANGEDEVVGIDDPDFNGNAASYTTESNLDSTVTEASAEIFVGWEGQFNLSHGPCEDDETPTPSPTPDDETPTPSPTPDDETPTPSPTPDDETPTPSPTPDDGTPSPTPDNGTPSPTPDDGTPSPTPDNGTPTEEPTTEPTEEPEEKPTTPVVPDDDDQSPPSTEVEVNTMPDTGMGSTLASIPTNHPINPMLLIAAAVVLTFVAGVNLKRDLLGLAVDRLRK